MIISRLSSSLVALALVVAASPASATSYVMATDDELLDRAPVVVLARVGAIESAPFGDRPATDYQIEIERLIKGFVPASNIIVRVPGGQRADGVGVELLGAPRFASDEQVLLFLRPQASGTFGVVELGLGAFRKVAVGGVDYAVRDLRAAHETRLRNDQRAAERARSHHPRRLDRYADWLADRASGTRRSPDYFDEQPELPAKVAAAFTLTRSSTEPFPSGCGATGGNKPIRWPEFDLGGRIRVVADVNGQPGVPGGGIQEIQDGLEAWNAVNGAGVDLLFNGTTSNLVSANQFDDRNLVMNEDPFEDIDGSFTGGGGTVAVTLAAFDCFELNEWENGVAHNMVEADIVFQNGTGGFLFGNSDTPGLDYAEVVTHELGHLIGIAHACGDSDSPSCGSNQSLEDAIMNAFVHGNGRGPTLASDDRQAAVFLYPKNSGGGGGGSATAPAAPSELAATAQNTSEILLAWKDNSNNETSFEIQERGIEGGFATIETVNANATSVLVTGIPAGSFRAYRVRARNSSGNSAFSNEASATTTVTPGACVENATSLCLNSGRFRVTGRFETSEGNTGNAMAESLTDDTGFFWFFNAANVEAVIKVLRGCGFNNHFWVFAGGLTDVEVTLTVSDMSNGKTKTYFNPQGTPFAPVQDTSAFATCP